LSEQAAVSFEKGSVEWDGRKITILTGVPSTFSNGACVVIAHGAGGPMYSPFITYFHTELAKRGFLTVKFNFPYMEARKRIPDRKEVLEDSFRRVIEQVRTGPHKPTNIFLGGKSMGGRIASQAVAAGLESDGLFFLGYPLHPPGMPQKLRDSHLYLVKVPMLFVSGTKDQFAGKDLLEGVVKKLGSRARIHWIEGGNHSLDPGKGKAVLGETYVSIVSLLSDWFREHSKKSAIVQ
jgi:predicted alpha/beta-hydrolase family hydrolase